MNGDTVLPLSVAEIAEIGRLFDEHRSRLLAMLERRIDPRLQARLDPEDVLQDAYVLAQRRWPEFRKRESVSPYAWLYRIVLDCLIEHWRKAARGKRDLQRDVPWPDDSALALDLGLIDTGTRPSEHARRRELEQRMKQAMSLLQPSDRELLWMRHYDQLSHREIAQVLSINENATAVRYVRALERLRRLWQQIEFNEGKQE